MGKNEIVEWKNVMCGIFIVVDVLVLLCIKWRYPNIWLQFWQGIILAKLGGILPVRSQRRAKEIQLDFIKTKATRQPI